MFAFGETQHIADEMFEFLQLQSMKAADGLPGNSGAGCSRHAALKFKANRASLPFSAAAPRFYFWSY
jgi:hypothetical protein